MTRTPRRNAFRPQGESLESRNLMAVITVTSTAQYGAGTLNWAINRANESRGPDTIQFQLPVTSTTPPYFGVIAEPREGFPVINGKVTIDGFTQPLSQRNTSTNAAISNAVYQVVVYSSEPNRVMLDIGPGGSGTEIRGIAFIGTPLRPRANEVAAVVINRANSVKLDGDGFASLSSTRSLNPSIRVVGGSFNTIGGDVAGTPALQNVMTGYDTSVELLAGSRNNAIFGNLIGGQPTIAAPQNFGLLLHPGADNNTIVGNILVKNVVPILNAGSHNLVEGNIVFPR